MLEPVSNIKKKLQNSNLLTQGYRSAIKKIVGPYKVVVSKLIEAPPSVSKLVVSFCAVFFPLDVLD